MDEFIKEARDARHKLVLGKSALVVQRDGRRVQYTPASLPSLDRYIAKLESEAGNKKFTRHATRVQF
ncbi:MAG: gpW family head-tail joining protein [Flavobacteriales bacterium]